MVVDNAAEMLVELKNLAQIKLLASTSFSSTASKTLSDGDD